MIAESKYDTDMMRKHFYKELVLTKEDYENSTKYWICHNLYVDGDVKVKDHCHIIGKYRCYRGSAHRDRIINVKS